MYQTLDRLKRRILIGRHRKQALVGSEAMLHWISLEQALNRISDRAMQVDKLRRIDIRKQGRRVEIVGLLNAWEQELRKTWTSS